MIKKVFAIALMLIALCACKKKPDEQIVPVASVTMSQPEAEMQVGETLQLRAQISPSNATEQKVMWASSKQSVATVSDAGLVTAVAAGTANITATVDGKTATCAITVEQSAVHVVPVESVSLDKADVTMEIGQSLTLAATVLPDNATDKAVEWHSSNPAIAEVDRNGKVTAVSEGSAQISASAGGKSASCQITVSKPEVPVVHVESVSLDRSDASLVVGYTLTLTATVLPGNADDKSVIWASTNPAIAEVDQTGKVTAKSAGTTTVTATTTDGGKIAGCEVTVTAGFVPITGVTLNYTEYTLELGESFELIAYPQPDNASQRDFSWRSSDGSVVYPNILSAESSESVSVQSIGLGTATITLHGHNDVTASCVVTVVERTPDVIHVQSVSLDKTSLNLAPGVSEKLVATVLPENAADKSVIWASVNPAIAEVDQEGNVTARSVGTTTITAYTNDGGYIAGCEVVVTEVYVPVESVAIQAASIYLYVGNTVDLWVKVLPENASNKTVTWTSSNPEVVSVDQNGHITALAGGEVFLTAEAGGKTDTRKAKVYIAAETLTLDKTEIQMKLYETATIHATVQPENFTTGIGWYSSNPAVVTVKDGVLKAYSVGTSTIKVIANNAPHAYCQVTVTDGKVPAQSIAIDYPFLKIGRGKEETLTATVMPSNSTDNVVWSVTDPSIATINPATGRLTALKKGQTTIVAKAGNQSASIDLTVWIPIERIELDRTQLEVSKGGTYILSATAYPEDADNATILWRSNNPDVATVRASDGYLWANNEGTAAIEAFNTSSGVSAICNVTVVPPGAPAIILEKDNYTVDASASEDIRIKYRMVNPGPGDLNVTVSGEGAGWLFDRVIGAVYFYVAENNSTQSRTARITIECGGATATVTVTQQGKTPSGPPDLDLDVNPDANNGVSPYGGDNGVHANIINPVAGFQVEMSTDVDWMTNLRSDANGNYYFTASKNTTGQARTGHFILTYGSVTKLITFLQEPLFTGITIEQNNQTVNYRAQVVEFDVVLPDGYSSNDLIFEPDDSWMTDFRVNGSTVSFNIRENNNLGRVDRIGSVKVSLGSESEYFRFTQTYDAPIVTVNPTTLKVNYKNQVQIIDLDIINEREAYSVSTHSDDDWLYGSGVDENGDLKVTIKENTTGATRSGVLRVSYLTAVFYLNVTQTTSGTTINVPTGHNCHSSEDRYGLAATITDPLALTALLVETDAPWIKISTRDVNETTVEVDMKIARNGSSHVRSASVVFSYGDINKVMIITQDGDTSIPEGFVDLGLTSGVLWAEMNLGAVNSYETGKYYAWGEVRAKTDFTWDSYRWGKPAYFLKYNPSDRKKTLEADDDAAANINSNWMIPSPDHWWELYDECNCEWVATPVPGLRVTSRNTGNFIFLPAAGCKFDDTGDPEACYYWSNQLLNSDDYALASCFYADWEQLGPSWRIDRYSGMPIRPVYRK